MAATAFLVFVPADVPRATARILPAAAWAAAASPSSAALSRASSARARAASARSGRPRTAIPAPPSAMSLRNSDRLSGSMAMGSPLPLIGTAVPWYSSAFRLSRRAEPVAGRENEGPRRRRAAEQLLGHLDSKLPQAMHGQGMDLGASPSRALRVSAPDPVSLRCRTRRRARPGSAPAALRHRGDRRHSTAVRGMWPRTRPACAPCATVRRLLPTDDRR